MADRLGQPFIVENRPGGGTNVGTEVVVRSAADGYTLLVVAPANASNATLYENLSFNFIRDIAPVSGIVRIPSALVVHPSVPAKTVPEFVAYAKANPGKLKMASAGIGTGSHMYGELFKAMTGTEIVHVPYRSGGPALTDLIGGQVEVYFAPAATSIEYIKNGKLRVLAVTTADRLDALPDIPAIAEFVPGYEASGWFGLGAPKNTPADVITTLNKEINALLADPKFQLRLSEFGGVSLAGSPADFGKLIVDETEKWGSVIRKAGIKAE